MHEQDPHAPADTPAPTEVEARIDSLERALRETRTLLDRAERSRALDAALAGSGAVDLETARLLAERAIDAQECATPAAAVASLRQRKPFLFRRAQRSEPAHPGSAMSARPREDDAALATAAADAAHTGGRDALLRYLRLRRGA